MAEDKKLKEFIKKHEGMESEVYQDEKYIPTVGIGSNLESPEVPALMRKIGADYERVKRGEQRLTDEQAEQLYKEQMAEKERYFNNIQKRDFPNAEISDREKRALLSLMYNNPQLIGPRMRQFLESGDDSAVVKEILLRSNKAKSPGIQKRRLEEARQYAGDEEFNNIVNTLTEEEKLELQQVINNMQNEHERIRVLNEYPFLKELAPRPRFRKIVDKQKP